MQDGHQVGQTGKCTRHHFSFGVGATHNVRITQKNSHQPLNRLQTPPPDLQALQIGVPPEVSCVQSPQGLIDSIIHEEQEGLGR